MRARGQVAALLLGSLALACAGSSSDGPSPLEPQPDGGSVEDPRADGGPEVTEPDAGEQQPPDDGEPGVRPPSLGAPIDRVGRVGINTLLTRTFDGAAARDAARDRYNTLTPKDREAVVDDFIVPLRLIDGIDRNCGNQFLSVPTTVEDRYGRLALRLGDDQLYVDTRSGTCWFYMGLETDEQGTVPNNDCGGRTLTEDAIDVTYALLVNGLRGPIRDGVARDDRVHSNEVFPFVAPPGADAPTRPSPPPANPVFAPSDRSCKNLGYTDSVVGGGERGFGESCGASSQCAGEDGLCVQNTCFYGGFCTTPCVDGDDRSCARLGANAACEWVGGLHACVSKCASDGDCGRPGYFCGPEGYCISQDL